MLEFLDVLRDGQVLLLIGAAVLTLGLAIMLWLRLRRLRLVPQPLTPSVDFLAPPREQVVLTPALMRQSFRYGLTEYRKAVAGSANPYLVPWVLAVGTRGGGTSALCAAGGSARPPAAVPDPATGRPLGCAWWFYDRAVVIDVAGEAFADLRGDRLPDGAWVALLEELVRARDGLPLDGILLTVPVPDLAGPEALPTATLAAKAAEIHTRLWQVQKVTGLTLPVWLVLTMGDAIPGFQPLLAALPEGARDGAFGWSSPYPLEASWQPGWIDEAVASLQDAAAAAGLELGAAGAGEATAAAAMRLPVELDHLRGPLATFLGVLFRQTGYQESLLFRGLWLTGAVAPAAATDQPPELGFVREMLAKKVFAERDLPRPVPRWSLQQDRRRAVWRGAVAAAAAVLALVLWSGVTRLEAMRASFVPALRALAGPVAAAQEGQAGAAPTEGAGPLAAIRSVARLGTGWEDPLWPIAAVDATAERVRTALAIGHWRLVMGEIRGVLLRRGRALAEGGSLAPAPAGGAPELRELRRFLAETLLLERYVLTFNRLGTHGGTVGLAELLRYTHGIDLPPGYVDRAGDLGFAELPAARALRGATVEAGAQPIDPSQLRAGLQPRLLGLAESWLARQVPPAESLEVQRQAAARLASLAEGDAAGAAARLEAAAQALDQALAAGGRDLPGLTAEGALASTEFQALLRVVAESRLLGPEARDAVLRVAQSAPGAEAQATVPAIGLGPLLAAAPERNRMEPSAPAARLQALFAALAARPFMQVASPAPEPVPPAAPARPGLFRWNVPALEAAVALVDDQALFRLRDLPDFPEPFRPAVQRAVQERLGARLVGAIAAAQLPQEGRDLAPVVEAARAAHPVLLRLLQALRAGASPGEATLLAEALGAQAQRLLEAGWAQLEAGAGYVPRGNAPLSWVEGKLDIAAFYDLADAAMLPALLGREREKLNRLVELARPMLAVLDAPDLAGLRPGPVVAQWRVMAEEMQRARDGRAGALAGLERMVGQDLAAVTPGTCTELAVRGAGDWFTDQAVKLRAKLRRLCRTEVAARGAGAFEALEESFGRLLAGRYPFAPLEQADRGPYATAERVQEFYARFDAQAEAALAALPGDPAEAQRAQRFIARMREARPFLTPLLGLEGQEAGLVLTPQFRALADRESGGDAVIEWRFAGRNAVSGTMSGQRPVPWKLGDPLSVTLRWARNAPVQPVRLLPNGPRAEAGAITITARDPWALVTLGRRLAAAPADWRGGPGDAGPMLALNVETVEAGDQPRPATPAKLFIGLGVTAQAAPAGPRLAWPRFPADWPAPAPRADLAPPTR